jgi:hypothetical protein
MRLSEARLAGSGGGRGSVSEIWERPGNTAYHRDVAYDLA